MLPEPDVVRPAVRGVAVDGEVRLGALDMSLDSEPALRGANGIKAAGGVKPSGLAFEGT